MSHVARLPVRDSRKCVHLARHDVSDARSKVSFKITDDKRLIGNQYSGRELQTPDCVSGAQVLVFVTISGVNRSGLWSLNPNLIKKDEHLSRKIPRPGRAAEVLHNDMTDLMYRESRNRPTLLDTVKFCQPDAKDGCTSHISQF